MLAIIILHAPKLPFNGIVTDVRMQLHPLCVMPASPAGGWRLEARRRL